jgi:hypothetical protein
LKVKISTEASVELTEAAAWYELEIPGLGEQLITSFEQATAKLSKPNPPLVPVIGKSCQAWSQKIDSSKVSFLLGDYSK